jgi:hypothetical protein
LKRSKAALDGNDALRGGAELVSGLPRDPAAGPRARLRMQVSERASVAEEGGGGPGDMEVG